MINDLELFFRLNQSNNCIGITGTNGKSTTVSLIHHVLNKLKIDNRLGGNIGKPVFDLKIPFNGFYILEISSYQLELMKSSKFKIGIILNISKDHMDRHNSFKKYISEKFKIFNNQEETDTSILSVDDKYSRNLLNKIKKNRKSEVVTISG